MVDLDDWVKQPDNLEQPFHANFYDVINVKSTTPAVITARPGT